MIAAVTLTFGLVTVLVILGIACCLVWLWKHRH